MKIKENFVLRQIAGAWVVLPLGSATLDFNGMLTLNESGVLLWRLLERGCERENLVTTLLKEYDVQTSIAEADVDEFLEKLKKAGSLEM
jgi:hypothetical protein